MAFRIAVSGLNAANADLNVTGNNIANANTPGFKESRPAFADVYATSTLGVSQDAIGQGVQLTAVAQQFNQGNVSFTNNNLDLAINGSGFFALEDTNGDRLYTRGGAFGVDKNGFVVNSTGQRLLAFQASAGTITGAVGSLQLNSANISPRATTQVDVGVNLDADAAVLAGAFNPSDATTFNNATSISVFDSQGQEHLASVFFKKDNAVPNRWETHLVIDNDTSQTTGVVNLDFDQSGLLTTAMPVGYGAFTPANGAAPFTLDFDFAGSTQFGAAFGVNSLNQDGFASGRLSGVDIDEEGIVLARFTNGESEAQGQIMLANFANVQGLQPVSETNWAETNTAGAALTGAPGSASLGLLQSGALEESNVDLAEQLVNMIVAQRNFQANAQMIRAEDEITQTIINIR